MPPSKRKAPVVRKSLPECFEDSANPHLIRPPPYTHCSAADPHRPYAPIISYPIPDSAEIKPIPSCNLPSRDRFANAYVTAFGNYPQVSQSDIQSVETRESRGRFNVVGRALTEQAVFVKHCMPGSEVSTGSSIRHPSTQRKQTYLAREQQYTLFDETLLTVAVVHRDDMVRTFDMHIPGEDLPIVIYGLAKSGHLRIFAHAGRLIFCVALGGERHLVSLFLRWAFNVKSGGEIVQPVEAYSRDWVYEVVRRTPGDFDQTEYQPYLNRVRECTALNVNLRPYQERAVAWMLSRELGERVTVFQDVFWDDANATRQSLVDEVGVELEENIVVNMMGKVTKKTTKPVNRRRKGIVEQAGASSSCQDSPNDMWGRGGLLCDEMGLGKTVELMQLVACNKMENSASERASFQVGPRLDGSCPICDKKVSRQKDSFLTCAECKNFVHDKCGAICFSKWDEKNFVCSKCCQDMSSVFNEDFEVADLPKSRATVVVIPTSLLHQWKAEFEKHVKDALNIIIFRGLRDSGYVSRKKLMEADVILTTYEAFAADVAAFKALTTERKPLRHARKYPPTPIPLLAIHWHRLALDESQMLGSLRATQAAEMAGFFHATYRWCVTGTPMHRVSLDAAAMLHILRIQGGSSRMNWGSFLKPSAFLEDEKRVQLALRKIMWRSAKEDVEGEELDLPSQTTEVVYASFGPVEKYHFESLQDSVRMATSTYTQIQTERTQLVSNDLLTMLRQACCHPQIGVSGRSLMSHAARAALGPIGSRKTRKQDVVKNALKRSESPLDMNEVLDALVGKAKVECEEALRVLVASSNGLAAVCWLQHSLLPARSTEVDGLVSTVQLYRGTLGLAEENRNLVRLDDIQKMHILFNLHEALDSVAETKTRLRVIQKRDASASEGLNKLRALGSTTRDAELKSDIDDLKQKYVAEADSHLKAAHAEYEEQFEKLGDEPLIPAESEDEEDLDEEQMKSWESLLGVECPGNSSNAEKKRKRSKRLHWWHIATASLLEREESRQDQFLNRVVQKLIDAIPDGGLQGPSMANRLTSLHSFPLVVERELRKLQSARIALRQALLRMPGSVSPTQSQVAESGQCESCREYGTGPACLHCRTEHKLKDVEKCLYLVRQSEEPEYDGIVRLREKRSSRSDSSAERQADPKALVSNVTRPKGIMSSTGARNQGGLRFQSETETILKSLASALRTEKDEQLNQQMAEWFERLEALKKEHTEARRLFESQRSLLARMDEVNMAVMRFSVLDSGENHKNLTEDEKRHRLPRESLPSLNTQFSSEKKVTEVDFRSKRGSLAYLKGLQRSAKRETSDGTHSRGIQDAVKNCAICLTEFDETVTSIAVFGCGHVFCCDCTRQMIARGDVRMRISNVQCPTCRVLCPIEEINFTVNNANRRRVKTSEVEKASEDALSDDEELEDVGTYHSPKKRKRKGDRSSQKKRRLNERASTFHDPNAAVVGLIGSKASAIVRTLRGIWQNQPGAKVLVFSEWQDVLNLISRALRMNDVYCLNGGFHTASALRFSVMVDEFRSNPDINVLLLPLRRAGAGLNLTEATHVILVEPSMNVSLEAQAVGRVHRIGQTRETFVHRIIIRDTIEEEILALGDAHRTERRMDGENKVNVSDLLGVIHSSDEPEVEEDVAVEEGTS